MTTNTVNPATTAVVGPNQVEMTATEESMIGDILKLTDVQAEGLAGYLKFVVSGTAETLVACEEFEFAGLTINITDVIDTARIKGHPRKCSKGHHLRYLYTVEVKPPNGPMETHQLGVVCASNCEGLNEVEKLLIRVLNRWVNNAGYKQVLAFLTKAIQAGGNGQSAWNDYVVSDGYDKVNKLLDAIEGREMDIVNKSEFTGSTQSINRKRGNLMGRVKAAINAANHLLRHDLPVPEMIQKRLEKAAKALDRPTPKQRTAKPLTKAVTPASTALVLYSPQPFSTVISAEMIASAPMMVAPEKVAPPVRFRGESDERQAFLFM